MNAMLEAEKKLREAHLKHSRDFFNPWEPTKVETVKPWAAFVKHGDKMMMRTFEKKTDAQNFSKNERMKAGMFTHDDAKLATSEVVQINSPRAKNLMEKVNVVSLTPSHSKSKKKDVVNRQPKKEKAESVKRQNLSLSL